MYIQLIPLSSQHPLKIKYILSYSTKCLKQQQQPHSSSTSPSSYLCNSIIRASLEKGSPHNALHHYQTLLRSNSIQLDHQTLSYVLEACKLSSDYKTVIQLHTTILKSGFDSYPSLLTSLISIYVSHDHLLDHALHVFDEIPKSGFNVVSANLIIAGYLRIRKFDNANRLFRKLPHRDVVSWNSMITGCVRNTRLKEALSLFRRMLRSGFDPDRFTFASILTACGRIGALSNGEWVHNLMIEKQIELNFILSSALIDMYSRCGRIETAKKVFESVTRDHISIWNSMITGLAINGLALEVIEIFSRLERETVEPDSITFIGILTACSHCGLVEEGRRFFDLMRTNYSIEPQIEHYGAVVDLLSRAGLLEEAHEMIRTMPMKPDVVIWRALLSACRIHGKPEFGEFAIEKMSSNIESGDYVLLSNIYSTAMRWGNAEKVRELMKKKGVRKNQGLSWIEMKGVIHQFKAGDRSNPESEMVYKVLEGLNRRIKLDGFVPATELVLMDVSEEEKEGNLNCHSEKLATAYGILKTSPGTEILVSKNLRTCYDCHCWMKMVSRVLNRVIIMRDRVRFHRFESGSCSCRDYW
ncbi:Pentatricopeptide repeat [Macleaya cordata]|uniref:Pentatricopeptide repeat n=1 Tax=Macleaya cordata TaxID=56857 RepID=A0A200QGW5_MACCD|nr:Pentatricopeptide repeat [Macleaya cordata]